MEKVSIDSMIDNLQLEVADDGSEKLYRNIPICVDQARKEKFAMLQELTKKKFGKTLREIIIRAIDRADIEELKNKASGF